MAGNGESHHVAPMVAATFVSRPRTCSSWGKAGYFHPATVCEMMMEKGGTRRAAKERRVLGEDWTNEVAGQKRLKGQSIAEGEERREAGAAETGRQGCV